MASAQLKGTLSIYIKAPSGARRLAKSAPLYWFAPGGSSDGVIANTPEKWNFLPLSADTGGSGYVIELEYTGGAATLDISDAVWVLPVMVNGSIQNVGNPANAAGLGNNNFVSDYEIGDSAIVASVPTTICQLRAKEGVTFKIGGDRVFTSLEDNA